MLKYKNKMLVIFFGALLTLLSGCGEPEVCDKSMLPKYSFFDGEKAIFKATKEDVRIIGKWLAWGGKCFVRNSATYSVRFNDGTEIAVEWHELKKAH